MNIAPPPGSLRPEQQAQPPPPPETEVEVESPARTLLARIANVLLGKALTLVLAAVRLWPLPQPDAPACCYYSLYLKTEPLRVRLGRRIG